MTNAVKSNAECVNSTEARSRWRDYLFARTIRAQRARDTLAWKSIAGWEECVAVCGQVAETSAGLTEGRIAFFYSAMKVREILRLIEEDGWFLVRTRGSHHQFHHRTKAGTVTVAGNLNDDLPKKTQQSILKQAGLR